MDRLAFIVTLIVRRVKHQHAACHMSAVHVPRVLWYEKVVTRDVRLLLRTSFSIRSQHTWTDLRVLSHRVLSQLPGGASLAE